jgi:hypothetical protein
MKKYLYYRHFGRLRRCEVKKETESYYILSASTKVKKQTLSHGSGWNITNYEIETPELVSEYKKECYLYAIKERLYELKDKDFSKFNDDYLVQILCELDKIHLKLED